MNTSSTSNFCPVWRPISFAQKNTRCEWLINTGVLNSRSKAVASRVILVSGTPAATCCNSIEGVGSGMIVLGRRNVGDSSADFATAGTFN